MHNKILPSGLCAEICCNRGEKKDFQVESGLFRDLFRGTSGLQSFFSKYAEEKKRHQQKYSTTTVGLSLFFRYTGMVRYCVICINVSKIEVIYIIFFILQTLYVIIFLKSDIILCYFDSILATRRISAIYMQERPVYKQSSHRLIW